jgi:pimeloyl-ACP methyl ester carboxylesterase
MINSAQPKLSEHEEPPLTDRLYPIRLARTTLRIAFGFAAVLFAPLALVLLAYHESLSGLLSGLSILCLLAIPMSVVWATRRVVIKRLRFTPLVALIVAFILLCTGLCVVSPPGTAGRDSRVGSHFPGPMDYRRYSIWNLIPEIDQVKLGIKVAPLADPIIDWDQARRIERITMPLYREMEANDDYARLGSVMNYAYRELAGMPFDSGHFYQFVPEHEPGERLPAIIFLHGSAGNFKVYLWVWEKFAHERRFIVLCPSFGFGNWEQPGGSEAVRRVRQHAIGELDADAERIYLVGLSNGGRGVARVGTAAPHDYCGLVFISGVVESSVLLTDGFVRGWRQRPMLVIHGASDDRIPAPAVQDVGDALADRGVDLRWRIIPDEDHFLFFSRTDDVFREIDQWLEKDVGP